MLGNNEACAVLAVKDMTESLRFYTESLGLTKDKEDPAGTLLKSGNSMILLYESPENAGTNKATALAWKVDDVAGTIAELKAKGVTFEHYPELPGVTLEGDVHVMGPTKAAWFKDPSGNILNFVSGM